MKSCGKCKIEKELIKYGKDKQKPDGLNSYCKECIRTRSSRQRGSNPGYCKEYAENYRKNNRVLLREKSAKRLKENKEKHLKTGRESYYRHKIEISVKRKLKRQEEGFDKKERLRQKEWRSKNPERYRKTIRKWQTNNRERINAHAKVHRAVKNGTLTRKEKCEKCETRCKTEGHHEDYSKPLIVQWLCRKCHASKIQTVKV